MVSVIESVVIEQPPERVFAFLAELENDARWRTEVLSLRRVAGGDGDGRVGDRYHQAIRPVWRRYESDVEITACRPPALLSFRDRTRPTEVRGLYALEPEGAGTRLTVTAVLEPRRAPLKLLGGRLARVLHSRIAFDLRRLQGVLEGSASTG